MFPGYVLINMIMNDVTWYIVRNTRGVTGFVGPGSKPVPLTELEMKNLGIRVPENISIIGFDDISFSAMNGLSTMHVSTDRLGRMAVRIMDHVLHSEDLRDCKLFFFF